MGAFSSLWMPPITSNTCIILFYTSSLVFHYVTNIEKYPQQPNIHMLNQYFVKFM